jgi:hypothetical protein
MSTNKRKVMDEIVIKAFMEVLGVDEANAKKFMECNKTCVDVAYKVAEICSEEFY